MRETFKIFALVFFSVLVPISLWNAGKLYLAQSCDPKFGCLGVFALLTFITFVCAIISAISISTAHYIFIGRLGYKISSKNIPLLLSCATIGFISNFSIHLVERIGTSALIIIWAIASLFVGSVIFKLSKKYNKFARVGNL